MRKSRYLALVLPIVPAMGLAVPDAAAFGQTAQPTATGNKSAAIEQVVVTAQRRAENIQKSSLSVSVLSSKTLTRAGVTQVQDLPTVAPGVQLGIAAQTAQPFIRGVGNADNTGFATSGVAFNVDGIYVAQPIAYGSSLFDLDRIEIVKGPQGTLYGRNATGGAINIITHAPSDTQSGYLGVEFGNYNLLRTTGAVNLPLSNTFDVRAAFQTTTRQGYFDDGTNDDKSQQGRIRARWKPNDQLTAQVNLQASHDGGNGAGASFDLGPTYHVPDPWGGTLSKASQAHVFSTDTTKAPTLEQRDLDVSGQIDYTIGDVTLTLLPAYRDVRLSAISYAQGFLFHTNDSRYKETSVEARVSYQTDRLKWISGVYFFNQDQTLNFNVNFFVIQLADVVPSLNTQSYAAFSQATYSLLPSLRAIGGIRYSHEDQSGYGADTYKAPPIGSVPFAADVSSHSIDWKAGLEYDIAAHNLAYATISTGYKASGFFPSPAGPLGGNTFKPERLTAYDAGLRNEFFDRTLQVNVEGFYWDYKDKQETITALDGIGLIDNVTINAGKATSKGGDLDVVWQITPDDRVSGNVEYLDTEYDAFSYQTPVPGTGCPITEGGVSPIGLPFFRVDCAGKPLSRSPKWSGSLSYDHVFNLGDTIGTLDIAGNAIFATTRWLAANFDSNQLAPGYGEGNVFATYTFPNGKWSVTGYVRNVSNEVVPTNAYPSLLPNTSTVGLNPPRTYGVQLLARF